MISAKPSGPLTNSATNILTFFIGLLFLIFSFKIYGFSRLECVIISGFFMLWLLINYWRSFYYKGSENEFRYVLAHNAKAFSVFIILVVIFYLLFPMPIPGKKKILAFAISFPALGITFNFLWDNF